jgi:cohesin complex subunit SA-1/2
VEEEAALDEGNRLDPVTPKARPRPRPIHRDKTPTGSENGQRSPLGSPLPPVTPSDEGGEQGLGEDEIATPKSSLKRPRTDGDDEALETAAPNGTSDPDHLEGTPDMQIRRKRIRH